METSRILQPLHSTSKFEWTIILSSIKRLKNGAEIFAWRSSDLVFKFVHLSYDYKWSKIWSSKDSLISDFFFSNQEHYSTKYLFYWNFMQKKTNFDKHTKEHVSKNKKYVFFFFVISAIAQYRGNFLKYWISFLIYFLISRNENMWRKRDQLERIIEPLNIFKHVFHLNPSKIMNTRRLTVLQVLQNSFIWLSVPMNGKSLIKITSFGSKVTHFSLKKITINELRKHQQ